MRVSIVGAGYVGVVTAAGLADLGHEVVCADVDPAKVSLISAGRPPVFEFGLGELLARTVGTRLRATTDVADAVLASDVTLLAVGTPAGDAGIDLSAVVAATGAIGDALTKKNGYHAVVVKSTVVPGTTDGVVRPLLEETSGRTAGSDLGVGVNPEFLTEGRAVADFTEPDRIVIGGDDERTRAVLSELYEVFPPSVPRVVTNTRTAEMIKYASNALLASSISFANEIGNLCAAVGGVDVVDVMHGVHLSRYLSPTTSDGERVLAPLSSYLEAGCGFGGSCLPKDVRSLLAEGERRNLPMRVLRATIETNEAQPDELLRIVKRTVGELEGRRVTVLGLAFKPDTADVRESPTTPVVERLLGAGARVTIHDPVVEELPDELRGRAALSSDLESCLRETDVVVLVTRWDHYRELPRLLTKMSSPPPLVDGRRMLPKDSVPSYAGIGFG